MPDLSRRQLLAASTILTLSAASSPLWAASQSNTAINTTAQKKAASFSQKIEQLEAKYQGEIGAAVFDMSSQTAFSHRGNQTFLFNSTGKVLMAAALLAKVDRNEASLDSRVELTQHDIKDMGWTPVTEKHLGKPGMTLAELCQASLEWSDNAGANQVIKAAGGPQAITQFLRSIGDTTTRSDRFEPELNQHANAQDQRDTTTPLAMLATLQKLMLGDDALSARSRHQLAAWMIASKTGDARLRKGLPADWMVAEKTGTSGVGHASDIGIAWPQDRAPLIIVAYTYLPNATAEQREEAIAAVATIASEL